MSMNIDPPKYTSVMRLGTTLKKTNSKPFLGQQILVNSQNKKCAALTNTDTTDIDIGYIADISFSHTPPPLLHAFMHFLAQAALRAPHEVALAMHSWLLLVLPSFSLSFFFSFSLRLLLLTLRVWKFVSPNILA